MSATVNTKTQDRCAVTGCGGQRHDAITHGRRWHVVDGLVYASERQCLVRHSWAHACAVHSH